MIVMVPLALALVPAYPKERHIGELGRWSTLDTTYHCHS